MERRKKRNTQYKILEFALFFKDIFLNEQFSCLYLLPVSFGHKHRHYSSGKTLQDLGDSVY